MSKREREITSKLIIRGEITSKAYHIKSLSPTKEKVLRGREYSRIPYIKGKKEISKGERILKDPNPKCLMLKRRDATCLFGGKTCSYELI